jgi:hypothetical protein
MGLVKTRRLAAIHKQQRSILLRQGYGGLKAGMKPPMKCNMQTRMRFGAHEDARACCKDAVPGR